tara:strand:- start:105 stop:446 length:342 start_codon:yes stop_codon:yes gene_type:complete
MKSAFVYFLVVFIGLLFVSSAPSSTPSPLAEIPKDKRSPKLVDLAKSSSTEEDLSSTSRSTISENGHKLLSVNHDILYTDSVELNESARTPTSQSQSFREKCQMIKVLIMKEK